MTEFWTLGVGLPGLAAWEAPRVEAAGWDGLAVVDSQNLAGDVYIALVLAAQVTQRLRLATGVTNPYTRHPAVTASAIATVHAESGGRAVLGIGRGDSALAHLGLAPAPVDVFERYLARLQGYLRGEEVTFDSPTAEHPGAVESLGLASRPAASRLQWLRPSLAKVPVSVAATGPRVIAAAARQADRCTFAVGADPDRLRWAIAAARARPPRGRPPRKRPLLRGVPQCGRGPGPGGRAGAGRWGSGELRPVFGDARHGDWARLRRAARRPQPHPRGLRHEPAHLLGGAPGRAAHARVRVRRFAILGPPAECRERLLELVALGLDHVLIIGPSIGSDREEAAAAVTRFEAEVLPGLH